MDIRPKRIEFNTGFASLVIITLILGFCHCETVAAEYVLSAPPRETPDSGRLVYQPLAEFLSEFLGEKVIYEHPVDWQSYERHMKEDKYDIVFDGPHFAAWRIETLSARPLLKLPGSLRFVLVVRRDDLAYQEPNDLIGQRICTLPAPNLGALTLYDMFPHPARQPEYFFVNGGFAEVAQRFFKKECSAAILRNSYYYKKASDEFRALTRVIKRSKGLTNQGITLSPRIKKEIDNKLIRTLTVGPGKSALQPILDRFYSKADHFVPSSSKDYVDLNLLQDTSIFGW